MKNVFIALGTNIEPRETHFIRALEKIAENKEITIEKISSIYQTAPVGYTDQADFLNMVIEVETTLDAMALLKYCQSIEQELGRKRGIRFGPRTIDLDILVYNQENSTIEELLIPHPRMHERAFVMVPFAEIAGTFVIPTLGQTAEALVLALPEEEKLDVQKWINHK